MEIRRTGRNIRLGPGVIRLNPGVANPDGTVNIAALHVPAKPVPATPPPEPKPGTRVRQETKPLLNKLEGRWLDHLRRTLPSGTIIHAQAKRFRLASGIWYKPDFVAMLDGGEVAWEVKGPKAFRGGFENLKFVAEQWPDVTWRLVWEEGGEWRQQTIVRAKADYVAMTQNPA